MRWSLPTDGLPIGKEAIFLLMKPMDRTYQFLAAQFIRRQAKLLAEQFDGLRGAEDVEFIHRARVASRRLRAALKMFSDCFDAKKMKRWRKQIRGITEGLGEARDRDVQIEFLCGILSDVTDKTCFSGISQLLVQLETEREQLQPAVVKATNRLEASGALEEMQAVTKGVVAETKGLERGGLQRLHPRPDRATHPQPPGSDACLSAEP